MSGINTNYDPVEVAVLSEAEVDACRGRGAGRHRRGR